MRNKVICFILLFIIWTILVLTNNLTWFDNAIYSFLISFKSTNLTNFMIFITNLSGVKFMIIVSILSLSLLIWKRKECLYLIGSLGVGVTLNLILKNIFNRERPINLRLIEENGFSYPSGHAMASLAFYGAIIVIVNNLNIDKKYKYLINIFLGLLIFLIGLSRIYLGVHHPSDIIGGWLIIIGLLFILDYIIKKENK